MHYQRGTTGSQQGLVQIDGFVIMETQLQSCAQIPVHTHENATIVLILAGQYRETFRGASKAHPPMTVIAKPSGEKHANDIGQQGARCLVIELTDEKIREMNGFAQPNRAPLIQENGPASRIGLRMLQELREPDGLTPLALEGAALQLIVELSRHSPRHYGSGPRWVKDVVELLHDRASGGWSLSSLASEVGVHPVHLARTFKRTQGCSVGEYARRLQLERVVQMLTQTETPLSDVALATGFYDQSHMSRAIRRQTGMNASQIRASTMG
jgi:AraC family transcriptional regulator